MKDAKKRRTPYRKVLPRFSTDDWLRDRLEEQKEYLARQEEKEQIESEKD